MTGMMDAPVGEVVIGGVVTVNESATLRAAARHMAARSVGAAVVVRGARNVGFLSERDIVERIGAGVDPATYTAGDAMTSPLEVASATETVAQVIDRMVNRGIRHLPVLHGDGHLLGMVSLAELLGCLAEDQLELDLREDDAEHAARWFG